MIADTFRVIILIYYWNIEVRIMDKIKSQHRIISHIDRLSIPIARRLHDLGLHNGVAVRIVRQFPFHGPVVIEYQRQRIGLRYPLFATITVDNNE